MKGYSNYIKSFQEIYEEYDFASKNLSKKTNYFNKLIAKGYSVPSAGSYYRYSTFQEAQKIKEQLELEIDRKYTLELTASFEAKSVYYFRNVLKRRSPLYASYTNLVPSRVRKGISHLMYNHFLDVYKEVIRPNNHIAYSEFKNLIEFRNWLAHGRGWDLPQHLTKFDFQYSYQIIFEIISLIPDYPDNLKK